MSTGLAQWWRLPGLALVDPWTAYRGAVQARRPILALASIGAVVVALGVATVPRQVAILNRTLVSLGDAALDAQREVLRAGVLRLIVVDRLVPSPTLLVAAILVLVAAEPVLMLARDQRPGLVAVIGLGLAPLVVQRVGELAVTYLLGPGAHLTAGDAIMAPHRFATGPALFWAGSVTVPEWVELLETRVNLVSVWCAGLWALGLHSLDGRSWAPWHLALPILCLAGAGVLTWAFGPMVIQIVLR
ncbi:MAG: hypothetical protein OEO20_04860 [Gemmatimonadota bacterium]|nr:hypothetical protein [Gemmatimonadota bacterium]MDH3366356.1 hypothetical protein [Gemmatimonadota bacterium]MDH3477614.1 hypothetical protein [Gemmatimonadota bacterium]MDH3570638.1 hypothetical protein [Gemmatimonadota bacterium]